MLTFTAFHNFVHCPEIFGVESDFGIPLRASWPKQWILMLWYEPFSGWKPFCVIWYLCYRISGDIDDTEVKETRENKMESKTGMWANSRKSKIKLVYLKKQTGKGVRN